MKIDAIDENSILVELSKEELSKNEVTFEQLDYANEKTRALVRSVLEKIRTETGRCVSKDGALEVDVMPNSSGGCLMLFTENRAEAQSEGTPAVFKTDEIDNLIDFSRRLKGESSRSALYRYSDSFFLFAPELSAFQLAVAGEYFETVKLKEEELNVLTEIGECLIQKNALAVLQGGNRGLRVL